MVTRQDHHYVGSLKAPKAFLTGVEVKCLHTAQIPVQAVVVCSPEISIALIKGFIVVRNF